MSLMNVRDALNWLNDLASFDSAEDFDNVGLLIGDERLPVQTVVFGLDATPALVREAVRLHAQLIVTHHPLIFNPLRRIHYADPIGQAVSQIVENRMSLIAAHTNWDKAEGGVGDSLAAALGLEQVRSVDDYLRVGRLPSPMAPDAFCALVAERLGMRPQLYGHGEETIETVAVAGLTAKRRCRPRRPGRRLLWWAKSITMKFSTRQPADCGCWTRGITPRNSPALPRSINVFSGMRLKPAGRFRRA